MIWIFWEAVIDPKQKLASEERGPSDTLCMKCAGSETKSMAERLAKVNN